MPAAVVVNHRTPELLLRCLESLLATPRENVDIAVVDSDSGDESVSAVRRRFPDLRVLELEENRGFAAAANSGVEAVSGDPILVVNADVFLLPGCLGELLRALEEHPRWGLCAPVLLGTDGAFQESSFRFPGFAQTAMDLFPAPGWVRRSGLNGRYPRSWALERDHEIDHPLGACMLIRREAWDSVAGFDAGFHMYCEEVDLCLRLRNQGWRSGHVCRARAVHVGGASTRQIRGAMLQELYISRLKYFGKHRGSAYAELAKSAMVAGLLIRALTSALPKRGSTDTTSGDWLRTCARVARF